MPRSDDVRRWATARARAATRERGWRRGSRPTPVAAVAQGFEVIDFAAAILGWPIPEDPVARRQADEARRALRTLRRRLAAR